MGLNLTKIELAAYAMLIFQLIPYCHHDVRAVSVIDHSSTFFNFVNYIKCQYCDINKNILQLYSDRTVFHKLVELFLLLRDVTFSIKCILDLLRGGIFKEDSNIWFNRNKKKKWDFHEESIKNNNRSWYKSENSSFYRICPGWFHALEATVPTFFMNSYNIFICSSI